MSYIPTQWQTGDTITAEKLNNIEQGIAGAVGAVVYTVELEVDSEQEITRLVLNASANDLMAAWTAGNLVFARAHLVDESVGFDGYCQFNLLYVGSDYGSMRAQFMGHDPYSGEVYSTFIPDAGGTTMSTDGGHVST